jgi:hypothetical protein
MGRLNSEPMSLVQGLMRSGGSRDADMLGYRAAAGERSGGSLAGAGGSGGGKHFLSSNMSGGGGGVEGVEYGYEDRDGNASPAVNPKP